MKKLLFLLVFIPLVSFGQTAAEYINSGYEKAEAKDNYGAIADYTKAIELSPNIANSYFYRGNSKIKLKDYYGAIADHTKAIELFDIGSRAMDQDRKLALAMSYNSRASAKFKLEDYSGAIADYTKAIELAPNNALAYALRASSKDLAGLNGCADARKAKELGNDADELIEMTCNEVSSQVISDDENESKYDNPRMIYDITSCICDYNDVYAPNKKIHISKFVNVPHYKSNEGYLSVYNRKEILDYEKILLDSIHHRPTMELGWRFLRVGFNEIKREFENIRKINGKKDFKLKTGVSSTTLLKVLQPNLYRKEKDKVIDLRKKLIEIIEKYEETGALLDCLVMKNYNKTEILLNEFKSSVFFWSGEKEFMDDYYRTRLTLSESIKFDTMDFYLLRRVSSFFGYFVYLLSIILIYRFLKLKRTKP